MAPASPRSRAFPPFPASARHARPLCDVIHALQLELNDNRLVNGLEKLSGCPQLVSLSLANNKIKALDALTPLVW